MDHSDTFVAVRAIWSALWRGILRQGSIEHRSVKYSLDIEVFGLEMQRSGCDTWELKTAAKNAHPREAQEQQASAAHWKNCRSSEALRQ